MLIIKKFSASLTFWCQVSQHEYLTEMAVGMLQIHPNTDAELGTQAGGKLSIRGTRSGVMPDPEHYSSAAH